MNEYLASSDAFTYTANRIRTKVGSSEPITWDENKGFGDIIDTINGEGKVETGVITLTSDVDKPISVPHSLGTIPAIVYVWVANREAMMSQCLMSARVITSKEIVINGANMGTTGVYGEYANGSTTRGFEWSSSAYLGSISDTAFELVSGNSYKWRAGAEIHWILTECAKTGENING